MTEEEEKFLRENFKAGEYVALTVLIRNEDLTKFTELLQKSGLKTAALGGVQAGMNFANPDVKGTEQ